MEFMQVDRWYVSACSLFDGTPSKLRFPIITRIDR